MTQIIPAILGVTAAELQAQSDNVKSLSSLISYDVADGLLVSPKSPEIETFPTPPDGVRICWHLMVQNPLDYLNDCLKFPTAMIIVHIESQKIGETISRLNCENIPVGLALNPNTPASAVIDLLPAVQFVQIMTVEPGGQGHDFLSNQLTKISEVHSVNASQAIGIDGGVNRDTINEIRRYQPEYLFVGSALTKSDDPRHVYTELQRLVG
jgi:ribulose-phosphate 3-epimerase